LYAIPVTLIIIALAHPFLKLWLGEEFAIKSTLVLQLISIGVLISAISTVPFVAIQALGRPDLTAKRHLIELPFYIGASWFCTSHWGIVGTSATWTVWVIIDTVVLFWLFRKTLNMNIKLSILRIGLGIISLTTAIIIAFLISNISNVVLSIMSILIEIIVIFMLNWRFILNLQDRIKLQKLLTSSFKLST
ncbi:MAG: hypothetical protein GXO93_06315, partial [FCB group bacterium]|nr:hypothetical protein [FCB group bacterium]